MTRQAYLEHLVFIRERQLSELEFEIENCICNIQIVTDLQLLLALEEEA